MKKVFYMIFVVLIMLGIAACRDEDPVETPIETPVETPVPTPEPTPVPTPIPTPEDTTAPIFFGVSDVVVNVGDAFNPMAGISALDDVDGNITNTIIVTGTYDLNTAGIYTLTYTVTDQAGNQSVVTRQLIVREVPESELFITNGDFSEPLEGTWTHWAGEGGASTASIVDGVLEYRITAAGNHWWSSQFSQPNLVVPQGKGFTLTFQARADIPRPMVVKLENAQFFGYIDKVVFLTTEWQTFELEFFMTDPTITNGKLIFGGGTMASYADGEVGALTTIYIDNVLFTEAEPVDDTEAPVINGLMDRTIGINETFNPLQGITVSDNMDVNLSIEDLVITGTVDNTIPGTYELIYTLTDASGNETSQTITITVLDGVVPSTWLVINGDFEQDQLAAVPQPADTGWGWHGAGTFTASIQNGVAKIDVQSLGTVAFGVQFYQQNRIIEQGRIYRITFDARADIARPIQVALEQGTTRRFDEVVEITTEWVTYTIEFEHVLPGYSNGKFAFFMGLIGTTSVPTTIYLDNVTVETIAVLVDEKAPVLNGVNDFVVMEGVAFDPLLGVTVFDNMDKLLTVDDILVTGTVDTSIVGIYQLTYVIADASGNEAEYIRNIHVKAAADMLSSTLELVNGDFSTNQTVPYPQPAMDGWGWHGGGTFTVVIENGIMTQVVTNVGTVPHGTQFYQQNLVTETQAIYRVRFDAKVDLARSIRLSLERGTSFVWFEIVDIGTEWATYEVFMNVPANGFTNAKFAFFVGLVEPDSPPTTFYLDNVLIDLVGYPLDNQAPIIMGVKDEVIPVGALFNPLAGVSVFDIYDSTLLVTDLVVTGEVNTSVSGYYTLIYELTDRQGNTAIVEREITVEADGVINSSWVFVNGDFEVDQLISAPNAAAGAPVTGWRWHNHGTGGAVTAMISDGIAQITTLNIGHHPYGVQFYQQNRIIEEGRIYRVTFEARADIARPMQVILEQGFTRRFTTTVDLTTEWQTYTIEFLHELPGYNNGKFGFFLGNAGAGSVPTTTYIRGVNVDALINFSDDVQAPVLRGAIDTVIRKDISFDPLKGLTLTDNRDKELTLEDVLVTGTVDVTTVGTYTLTYTVIDAAGNVASHDRVIHVKEAVDMHPSTWILKNGDFATDQAVSNLNTGWDWRTSGTGAGSTVIADGMATVTVTSVGTVPHGYQLNNFLGVTETGGLYRVTFTAKSDVARTIKVVLENAAIFTREFDVDIALTTEFAEYTIEFVHVGTGLTNAKLGFFLGNVDVNSVPATFQFQNVDIELIGYHVDGTAPIIVNAGSINVEKDSVFNPLAGIQVFDLYDRTLTVDDIVVTGTVDTAVVGYYVLTYTLTDRSGNETVLEREVGVAENGLLPSSFAFVNGDFAVNQAETLPNLASGVEATGWRWHNHGTGGAVNGFIADGVAQMEVLNIGHHPYGVQFYQQNRTIEQGRIYRVTFDAKADIARPIQVILEQGTSRRFTFTVDVTTEWQTYTVEFLHHQTGYVNGKFGFFLGNAGAGSVPTTLYFDNVSVDSLAAASADLTAPVLRGVVDTKILKGIDFDPLMGLTLSDNVNPRLRLEDVLITGSVDTDTVGTYVLTYTVTDLSGNQAVYERTIHVLEQIDLLATTWILKNAQFADQAVSDLNTGWDWRTSGTGAGSTVIADGVATIEVTNVGTVPHGYQFNNYFGITEPGGIYRLTFVAKASDARNIKVVLENATIFTREFDVNILLTTEFVEYTIEFVHKGTGLTNGKLGFFLGNVDLTSIPTTFVIQSVDIELIGYHIDLDAPVIANAHDITVALDATFDPLAGVQVFDIYDRTLTLDDVVVTGTVNTAVAGTYVLTYEVTDRQGNTLTHTRTITVA